MDYGIFAHIYYKNPPNVGKYTIHGWYGNGVPPIHSTVVRKAPPMVHQPSAALMNDQHFVNNEEFEVTRNAIASWLDTGHEKGITSISKEVLVGRRQIKRECTVHFLLFFGFSPRIQLYMLF